MTGVSSRVCGPDGVWESPAPVCNPNTCQLSSSQLVAEVDGPYYYMDRVSHSHTDLHLLNIHWAVMSQKSKNCEMEISFDWISIQPDAFAQ